jgi:hypothetical protein
MCVGDASTFKLLKISGTGDRLYGQAAALSPARLNAPHRLVFERVAAGQVTRASPS